MLIRCFGTFTSFEMLNRLQNPVVYVVWLKDSERNGQFGSVTHPQENGWHRGNLPSAVCMGTVVPKLWSPTTWQSMHVAKETSGNLLCFSWRIWKCEPFNQMSSLWIHWSLHVGSNGCWLCTCYTKWSRVTQWMWLALVRQFVHVNELESGSLPCHSCSKWRSRCCRATWLSTTLYWAFSVRPGNGKERCFGFETWRSRWLAQRFPTIRQSLRAQDLLNGFRPFISFPSSPSSQFQLTSSPTMLPSTRARTADCGNLHCSCMASFRKVPFKGTWLPSVP